MENSSNAQQVHTDWRGNVNLSENYSKDRKEFIQMLEPFPTL